jgi:hypothetical protein
MMMDLHICSQRVTPITEGCSKEFIEDTTGCTETQSYAYLAPVKVRLHITDPFHVRAIWENADPATFRTKFTYLWRSNSSSDMFKTQLTTLQADQFRVSLHGELNFSVKMVIRPELAYSIFTLGIANAIGADTKEGQFEPSHRLVINGTCPASRLIPWQPPNVTIRLNSAQRFLDMMKKLSAVQKQLGLPHEIAHLVEFTTEAASNTSQTVLSSIQEQFDQEVLNEALIPKDEDTLIRMWNFGSLSAQEMLEGVLFVAQRYTTLLRRNITYEQLLTDQRDALADIHDAYFKQVVVTRVMKNANQQSTTILGIHSNSELSNNTVFNELYNIIYIEQDVVYFLDSDSMKHMFLIKFASEASEFSGWINKTQLGKGRTLLLLNPDEENPELYPTIVPLGLNLSGQAIDPRIKPISEIRLGSVLTLVPRTNEVVNAVKSSFEIMQALVDDGVESLQEYFTQGALASELQKSLNLFNFISGGITNLDREALPAGSHRKRRSPTDASGKEPLKQPDQPASGRTKGEGLEEPRTAVETYVLVHMCEHSSVNDLHSYTVR